MHINAYLTKDHKDLLVKRLLANLPDIVKEILLGEKAWVAGGYILSVITKAPIKDIDVFFQNYDEYSRAKSLLTAKYSNNADIKTLNGTTTFRFADGRPSIQLISNWLEDSPTKLLDKFDFTISQAALYVRYGLFELTHISSYFENIAKKELVYNPNDDFRGSSILRIIKYAGRGYNITTEELSIVLEALYANAYPTFDLEDKKKSTAVLNFLTKFRTPSNE